MNERYSKRILIAGAQGCGKTHTSLEFAAITLQNNKRVLILCPDNDETLIQRFPEVKIHQLTTFTKIGFLVADFKDKFFYEKIANEKTGFRNGLFIIDDGKSFTINSRNEDFVDMIRRARQRNLDVIFSCHGMTDVPPSFWTFFTDMILFYTSDNLKKSSYSIPNMEEKIEYQQRVNDTAWNTGNGRYKEHIKLQLSVQDFLKNRNNQNSNNNEQTETHSQSTGAGIVL